jgi:hypothetical protein
MDQIATWVLDGLTSALVVVAIGALVANWRSANASNRSADSANRLFELEQAEFKRREEAERPNLQLYHAYVDPAFRQKTIEQVVKPQVHFDFMNFGERPAKVIEAHLEASKATFRADARTTPCVRHHEILRLTANQTQNSAIRLALLKAVAALNPDAVESEGLLQAANKAENISEEYRTISISLCYSETDGTGERLAKFTFAPPTAKSDYSGSALTMRVLHDPKEEERGDLPG